MSAETKFTPGPWEIFDLDIGPSNEITVCCMSPWLDEWHAERNANAYLIAASPELYAALEAVVKSFGYDDDAEEPPNWEDDPFWMARLALAKARGESQ